MTHAPRFAGLRKVSGFTIVVVASTLVGFIATAILFRRVGGEEWANMLVGQVVAGLAVIFVLFGWGATGAAMIAGSPVAQRPALYLQSLRVRSVLFLIVTPIAAVVATLITRGDLTGGVLATLTYLIPGLAASWYFVGEGKPRRLVLFDALPGLLGTFAGAIAVLITAQMWTYLVCQAAGYAAAVVISGIVIRRDAGDESLEPPLHWRAALSGQRHAILTTATSGLYVALPYLAVSLFIRPFADVYGLADRTLKYANVAFSPVLQYFQGWVAAVGEDTRARARTAGRLALLLGVIGGVGLALLMPPFTLLLSGGQASVSYSVAVPLGVAFAAICVSAVVGLACLAALGHTRELAVSTVLGAAIGAPLILLAAWSGELFFVATALAVSEAIVATYQVLALRRVLRDPRGADVTV
ncbi:hypothetical protein [Microbacterium gorillae]|uniref:hypothetical protein n=1 Tax=Microbacterium gorillae TaxID=1231063 RepID=UPI003D964F17